MKKKSIKSIKENALWGNQSMLRSSMSLPEYKYIILAFFWFVNSFFNFLHFGNIIRSEKYNFMQYNRRLEQNRGDQRVGDQKALWREGNMSIVHL